jgi:hypothetical protein
MGRCLVLKWVGKHVPHALYCFLGLFAGIGIRGNSSLGWWLLDRHFGFVLIRLVR